MILELTAIAVIGLDYLYHRVFDKKSSPKREPPTLQLPTTEEGAAVPLVFGRVRVRSPVLAWAGSIQFTDVYIEQDGDDAWHWTDEPMKDVPVGADVPNTPSHRVYGIDMLFVAGIPMGAPTHGNSLGGPKLHKVWWGDIELPGAGTLPLFDGSTTFYGANVSRATQFGGPGKGGGLRGAYYWHGGWTDQDFNSPASRIGDQMTAAVSDASLVPGLAKQMCVSFVRMVEDGADPYIDQTYPDVGGSAEAVPYPSQGFVVGEQNSVDAVSFEVSSYGDAVSGVSQHIFSMSAPGVDFGGDADPAEVIYELLTGRFGKLAVSPSLIDTASFLAVSSTLKQEGHGFSRCWDARMQAREMIDEVLEQIDGMLFESPKTGKYKLRLIRPDHDYASLPHITRHNCKAIQNLAISGSANAVNKVRLVYTSREKDYNEESAIAQDMGNVFVQGEEREAVLHYPGITRAELASAVATRELAWRSHSIIKCRALVWREFLDLEPGDAVKVTWSKPDISGLVFRIAGPPYHGTLRDNCIALDLISDNNYQFRSLPPQPPLPHPDIGSGIVLGLGMR